MNAVRDTIRATIVEWLNAGEDGPRLPVAGLEGPVPTSRSVMPLSEGTVLRCFDHLDVADLDALVIDPMLNVLGFVHIASAPEGETPGTAIAESLIQQAGYLRFLAAEMYGHERPAPAIELVLARPSWEIDNLRRQLGRINRETHLLHGIGLNLLDIERLRSRNLARAFCWLLPATRRLYESYTTEQDDRVYDSVTLKIGTLRNIRDLTLRLSERVTVIRGRNGTGKSTIAEAAELALTGDSARLRDLSGGSNTDVLRALRPMDAPNASVEVTLSRGPLERSWSGEPPHRQPQITALAFRLDVQDMQRLSASDPVRRLAILDKAFSLGADREQRFAQALNALTLALHKNAHIIADLFPQGSAEEADVVPPINVRKKLARHVASLIQAKERNTHRRLVSALLHPHDPKDFETLGIEIASLPSDELTVYLDEAVKEFSDHMAVVRHQLPAAIEALRSVADWRYRRIEKSTSTLKDRDAALQKMQRLVAIHETISSLASLAAAADAMLEAAERQPNRAGDDESEARALEGLRVLVDLDEQINLRLISNDIEADLFRYADLAAMLDVEDGNTPIMAPRRAQPLTRRGQEALDALAPMLKGPLNAFSPDVGLGTTVARAMASPEQRIAFGDIAIGSSGWANVPMQIMERLQKVLRNVEDSEHPGVAPSQRWADLIELQQTLEEYDSQEKALSSTFMRKLDPFAAAFNEVVALMTTARWAYDPLRLTVNEQRTGLPIAIERSGEGGVGVEAILNTAELNVITLALFLLLAPRMPNDARLLVLDDPWHAMDEQSASTASRALSQILKLLPPEWRVLALVHGDFHAATLSRETSAEQQSLSWFDTRVSLSLEASPSAAIPLVEVLQQTTLLQC